MLPFGMFVYGEPRTVHTVYPACPESRRKPRSAIHQPNRSASLTLAPALSLSYCQRRENFIAVSPLFATHMDRSQITENPATLSPFLATHTDLSRVSLVFATHTKTTGVCTNNSHSGTHLTRTGTNRRDELAAPWEEGRIAALHGGNEVAVQGHVAV